MVRRRPLLLQRREAQGRVSPALTDGKRAPSAKAPEGSRDTAPCRDTEPPHTVRPFPDPAGQQSRRSRCLCLQTCRHTPDENGKRLPQRPVTPTPARAQGQRGHQTPSDTKRQEIQTSTCSSSSQRFIYKNGREESGCPPSLPGVGGSVLHRALRFSSSNFYSRSPRPSEWCSSTRSPGLGSGRGPGGGRGRLFLNGLWWCLTPRRHTPPTPHQAPLGTRAGVSSGVGRACAHHATPLDRGRQADART